MMRRRHGRWMAVPALLIATGVGLGAVSPTAARAEGESGQAAAEAADPVVARIDGVAVYRSDVQKAYAQLPQQYRMLPMEQLFEPLLKQVIDGKLLAEAGRDAGLLDDPEVVKQMQAVEEQVVRNVFLRRMIDEQMTEDRLQAAYDEFVANYEPEDEVHARHILLETREEADAVVEALKGGADFEELAKEKSTGPTGETGGDLGFFKRGEMVKPFADAAFALEPGQISDPVKTQFGWHVIKAEGRRKSQTPSFDEVRDQLEADVAREIVDGETAALREAAEVETFGIEGEGAESNGSADKDGVAE